MSLSTETKSLIPSRSTAQTLLLLEPLCLFEFGKLFLCRVVCHCRLVLWVVGVLVELLSDQLNLLVTPEAFLILHLLQSSLLVGRISGLVPPFRMSVDLVSVFGSETERVESVVDAGGVK